ncbi:outer membrane beta-barrel protein [Caulobacter sp. 17J65-9]|uniref:outer membrane beta-barrel protein n=1 Tax=Caulobacter sp. 17J65-9 TaxID=2709382 RepID=UPI0013CC558E|nr:outer membrane beta-barrel protein [Caulobacter sp. 17J65-9]NEX95176.1 hypothetical protein [Caulobacter sp. 17J65-9]
MKTLLTASAAAVALFAAAPAFAGSGQLDASYGQIEVPYGDNIDALSIGGAATTEIASGWNIQGDATVKRLSQDGDAFQYTDAGLHLFTRNDAWTAGVYADTTDMSMMSAWGLGVEGAYNFDKVTVDGSLGYNTIEVFGTDLDGWNVTAGATYFVTDNLAFGADLGRMEVEDMELNTWTLSGEWKPEASPVSFYAEYNEKQLETFGDFDVNTWTLGVRWTFGADSLKSRERSGASLKGGLNFSDILFAPVI